MAVQVYRRKLVSRSTFKNVPFGAVSTPLGAAPLIKIGRRQVMVAFNATTPQMNPVPDVRVAVRRVPRCFGKYNGLP